MHCCGIDRVHWRLWPDLFDAASDDADVAVAVPDSVTGPDATAAPDDADDVGY